jgi:hypothetical protein
MAGIGVIAVQRKNLAVKRLRPAQIAALVQLNGLSKYFRSDGHGVDSVQRKSLDRCASEGSALPRPNYRRIG